MKTSKNGGDWNREKTTIRTIKGRPSGDGETQGDGSSVLRLQQYKNTRGRFWRQSGDGSVIDRN